MAWRQAEVRQPGSETSLGNPEAEITQRYKLKEESKD
jgi:hypothetical protein